MNWLHRFIAQPVYGGEGGQGGGADGNDHGQPRSSRGEINSVGNFSGGFGQNAVSGDVARSGVGSRTGASGYGDSPGGYGYGYNAPGAVGYGGAAIGSGLTGTGQRTATTGTTGTIGTKAPAAAPARVTQQAGAALAALNTPGLAAIPGMDSISLAAANEAFGPSMPSSSTLSAPAGRPDMAVGGFKDDWGGAPSLADMAAAQAPAAASVGAPGGFSGGYAASRGLDGPSFQGGPQSNVSAKGDFGGPAGGEPAQFAGLAASNMGLGEKAFTSRLGGGPSDNVRDFAGGGFSVASQNNPPDLFSGAEPSRSLSPSTRGSLAEALDRISGFGDRTPGRSTDLAGLPGNPFDPRSMPDLYGGTSTSAPAVDAATGGFLTGGLFSDDETASRLSDEDEDRDRLTSVTPYGGMPTNMDVDAPSNLGPTAATSLNSTLNNMGSGLFSQAQRAINIRNAANQLAPNSGIAQAMMADPFGVMRTVAAEQARFGVNGMLPTAQTMVNRMALQAQNPNLGWLGDPENFKTQFNAYNDEENSAWRTSPVGSPNFGYAIQAMNAALENPYAVPGPIGNTTHFATPEAFARASWGDTPVVGSAFGHTFSNPDFTAQQVEAARLGLLSNAPQTQTAGYQPMSYSEETEEAPQLFRSEEDEETDKYAVYDAIKNAGITSVATPFGNTLTGPFNSLAYRVANNMPGSYPGLSWGQAPIGVDNVLEHPNIPATEEGYQLGNPDYRTAPLRPGAEEQARQTLAMANAMALMTGTPVTVNDVLPHHNSTRVQEAPNSAHFAGMAIDFGLGDLDDAARLGLFDAAQKVGFNNFGFGPNQLHADVRPVSGMPNVADFSVPSNIPQMATLPAPRSWRYSGITSFGGVPIGDMYAAVQTQSPTRLASLSDMAPVQVASLDPGVGVPAPAPAPAEVAAVVAPAPDDEGVFKNATGPAYASPNWGENISFKVNEPGLLNAFQQAAVTAGVPGAKRASEDTIKASLLEAMPGLGLSYDQSTQTLTSPMDMAALNQLKTGFSIPGMFGSYPANLDPFPSLTPIKSEERLPAELTAPFPSPSSQYGILSQPAPAQQTPAPAPAPVQSQPAPAPAPALQPSLIQSPFDTSINPFAPFQPSVPNSPYPDNYPTPEQALMDSIFGGWPDETYDDSQQPDLPYMDMASAQPYGPSEGGNRENPDDVWNEVVEGEDPRPTPQRPGNFTPVPLLTRPNPMPEVWWNRNPWNWIGAVA